MHRDNVRSARVRGDGAPDVSLLGGGDRDGLEAIRHHVARAIGFPLKQAECVPGTGLCVAFRRPLCALASGRFRPRLSDPEQPSVGAAATRRTRPPLTRSCPRRSRSHSTVPLVRRRCCRPCHRVLPLQSLSCGVVVPRERTIGPRHPCRSEGRNRAGVNCGTAPLPGEGQSGSGRVPERRTGARRTLAIAERVIATGKGHPPARMCAPADAAGQ